MNASQVRVNLIRPILEAMGQATPCKHSLASENIMMGTWAHESLGGKYIKQVGGPACGIFQIEPATAHRLLEHYVKPRKVFVDFIARYSTQQSIEEQLVTNLALQVIIARLVYYPKPQPMPAADDLPGLAAYYKLHYNTPLGKSTVQKFLRDYALFVK